jgi:hypothetical protein
MKLKALVKDKVMLTLLDSGSSHSFVSSNFVKVAKLQKTPIQPRRVKLANGEVLIVTAKVQNLHWYIQGHTLVNDMIVLDMSLKGSRCPRGGVNWASLKFNCKN